MPVKGYTPSYDTTSPYGITPIAGDYMYYYIHRPIGGDSTDIVVTVDNPIYVNRPDRLAYDLYNNADLWWVFGVRNGWEDLVYDLKLGITVMVPTAERVGSLL